MEVVDYTTMLSVDHEEIVGECTWYCLSIIHYSQPMLLSVDFA